jgi:hypothetical protein
LNYSVLIDAPSYVEPGQTFQVDAVISGFEPIIPEISVPEGFIVLSSSTLLGLEDSRTESWILEAERVLSDGPYTISVSVSGLEGFELASASRLVNVEAPIRVPLTGFKIPTVNVVQERLFYFGNVLFHHIMVNRNVLLLSLIFFLLAFMISGRNRKPRLS